MSQHNPTTPITDEVSLYAPDRCISRGEGDLIWFDGDPQSYMDLMMGYSSTNFGHANPIILEIVKKSAEKGGNIPAFDFQERHSLSSKLIGQLALPSQIHQVYYPIGGAKAVDAALKLAYVETSRGEVLTFHGAFHGYISGLLGITDPAYLSDVYKPLLNTQVHRIPLPIQQTADEEDFVLDRLDTILKRHGHKIGTFLLEPIQGAAGIKTASVRFFAEMQKLLRDRDIVIIVDEIQTGLGRTGTFYAHQRLGIKPDIVLLGKSLAGGYYPLSAVIAPQSYFDRIGSKKSGFDSTFSNNIFGIRIANGVVDYYLTPQVQDHIAVLSHSFGRLLREIRLKNSNIVEFATVIGLIAGLKIHGQGRAANIRRQAFQERLVIQTAGENGDYIKIAPSLLTQVPILEDAIQRLGTIISDIRD